MMMKSRGRSVALVAFALSLLGAGCNGDPHHASGPSRALTAEPTPVPPLVSPPTDGPLEPAPPTAPAPPPPPPAPPPPPPAPTPVPVVIPVAPAPIDTSRLSLIPDRGLELCGRVQRLVRDEPGRLNGGGYMIVADQKVVIPRNMIIDLPVLRLTLEELFEMAPEPFHSRGVSGIAAEDGPPANDWIATVFANRVGGAVIAGHILLTKREEVSAGIVTSIDYERAELVLDGDASGTIGTRVRINDPTGVFSVQSSSLATGPGSNGSPDVRNPTDPENAMITAATGYPMRIPSVDPALGDDPLCPRANRDPSIDSALGATATFFAPAATLQAPILVGDHVVATGAFEVDPGPDQVYGTDDDTRFLSATALDVICWIFTLPSDPCYVKVELAQWIAPPFPLRRVDLNVTGFCTDLTSNVECKIIRRDPIDGSEFFESFGVAPVLPFGKFVLRFSMTLGGGGGQLPVAPGADLVTLARDLRVATDNQRGTAFLNRGGFTTPVSIIFPEPEINRRFLGEPWEFRQIAWLLDGDGTPRSSGPLDPFPSSDPRPNEQIKTVRNHQLVSRASVGLPTVAGDLSR